MKLIDPFSRLFQNLFDKLEKINGEFPYADDEPSASEFLVAKRMGEIIYKDNNTLELNMELYLQRNLTFKHYEKLFSSFFIVEEEDFDWKKLVD